MSKVKYDGWCAYYLIKGKHYLYPGSFHGTKKALIEWFDSGSHPKWKEYRRAGRVKAVKVRIVEV